MAQHIPTRMFKQKAFRKIENGIDYAFNKSKGLMKTSLKYLFIGMQEGKYVYITYRNIPKGIVCGSEKALLEIHFDKQRKIISEIYLVA